jgi:hypothetical protein
MLSATQPMGSKGGVVALILIAGLGYLAYQYFASQWTLAESWALEQRAEQNLYIGMSRAEAQMHLQHAEHHVHCEYNNTDYYMFGSSKPRLAATLYLRFEEIDGTEVLTQIAHVEHYQVPLSSEDCLPDL